MAAKRKAIDSFEDRFFDLLEGTIRGIDQKVDKNTAEIQANTLAIQAISSRLKRLEKKVFPRSGIPPWYSDRKLLYLALGSVFLFLSIWAATTGVKVQLP